MPVPARVGLAPADTVVTKRASLVSAYESGKGARWPSCRFGVPAMPAVARPRVDSKQLPINHTFGMLVGIFAGISKS